MPWTHEVSQMPRFLPWAASTLARRIVLSLLLAFALVSLLLTAQSYIEFSRDFKPGADSALVKAVRIVVASLAPIHDPHDAMVVMQSIQVHSNMARQQNKLEGQLLIELLDAAGRRIHASEALKDVILADASQAQVVQHIGAQDFRVAQASKGDWTVRFAEPRLSDRLVLALFLSDLWPSLLLALPVVLLTVWLAVRQGLKPLRALTAHLDARHADDLSPLAVDLRHAELRSVGQSFDGMLAKLRQHMSRERAFVQDAAHELRTPMAVIGAQAHVLARAVDQAARAQAEGALLDAIRRASHLAQQLLALASMDASRAAQPQSLDLALCLQTILAQAQPLAAQRQIELSLEAPDNWVIDIDRNAFESIALNLIDNAIRYGRPTGRVMVQLAVPSDQGWRLSVADDGPGIPLSQRAHMFERFVRGAGQDQPCTGLGLAIVWQAVQRLGARIAVDTGPSHRGVSFLIHWPAHESLR